jgi:site-specific DNA recombinase
VKRAAIYARYSSDLQNARSIDDQVAICRTFAERQGWTIAGLYSDAALSGFGRENRPDYERLRRDALAAQAPFDVVLVEDLSRLTRNLSELLTISRELGDRNVAIIGITDGISTAETSAAKIHVTVKGLVNELYLDDLREKTHRGMAGAFARGFSPGGRVYGYRSIRGEEGARLEIEPAEADVVRRIFREYAAGASLRAIARKLNAERVPFPAVGTRRERIRGGWGASTIRWIIRNERYRGRVTWNRRRFVKDHTSGKRRPRPRSADELTVAERPELRIVPEELWAAVTNRIARLRERYGTTPRGGIAAGPALASRFLLSGLLRCAHCGARMVGTTTTRRKGGKAYRWDAYRCGFHVQKGAEVCGHATRYRKEPLEETVLERFRSATSDGMVDEITVLLNDAIAEVLAGDRDRPADLAREMARLRAEATRLVRFLAEGESSFVREELQRIEAELAGLETEKARIAKRVSMLPPRVEPAWVRDRLARLGQLLEGDPPRVKAVLADNLEGELRIRGLPAPAGQIRAEIVGAVNATGLLGMSEEAGLQAVHCGGVIATALPAVSAPLRAEFADRSDHRRR